ncbi:nucleoside triphosphate pyrophosphohydrolase [Posidoniimonas corsicana]|uniref:Nucleoside triphosphate pyrophosphohydrolase n=2 Tax=Posidoniimonas corsicana TaxID=1938618 RepID=A0A5C5VEH7_9BACT|nr:nucleoside triphosphate pyrophosphohydrolase [Posidoniimonas corsicana]
MVREAAEEAGLTIAETNLRLCHVVHRKAAEERVSFFFTADEWSGEPVNREPHKCRQLSWFSVEALPENMVPYVRQAIQGTLSASAYSEYGWT